MSFEEKKVPEDFNPDERVVTAIKTRLNEGLLACADAHSIARTYGVKPITVGRTADATNTRFYRCQLGLFGYPGKQGWAAAGVKDLPVPEGFEAAMREASDGEGHLPCAKAWALASQFRIPRMQVGYIADQLEIKITPCQLGAF